MCAVLALTMVLALCAGCQNGGTGGDTPLLSLSFDEGSGNQVSDGAGQVQPAAVAYNFTNAAYKESRDPEWRTGGVQNGCLLFDGNSNYISYAQEEILVQGSTFTVSVWAAPRAFEWDGPDNELNGSEHLTAIVGQYDKDKKRGFILGYHRFGKLFFQVGTGEEWISVSSGDARLAKDAWNQITAVFDGKGGAVKLYLNGKAVGEKAVTAGAAIVPAEKQDLLVGKNAHGEAIAAGSYQMFSGLMDELKLYGKVFSAEEISQEASVQAPEIPYEDIALVGAENIFRQVSGSCICSLRWIASDFDRETPETSPGLF